MQVILLRFMLMCGSQSTVQTVDFVAVCLVSKLKATLTYFRAFSIRDRVENTILSVSRIQRRQFMP